jgi:hypothetical protein
VRRFAVAAVVGVLVTFLALVAALAAPSTSSFTAMPAAHAASTSPFAGLGTWVDVFDYAPRLQKNGALPLFTPAAVDDVASLGVRTLYVQVANPDADPATRLTDTKELQAILERAHRRGLKVVAWFLPAHTDPARDDAMVRRIAALRARGQQVDGVGLDLESSDVGDVALRSRRAIAFAKAARRTLGEDMPIAAIVYPAVQLEQLNPVLWPQFPYKQVNPYVDAWMPMAYFTYRDGALRDPRTYVDDSVKLLRKRVGDDVPVHVIGGIADVTTSADIVALRAAARDTDALGWSLYDYVTTGSAAWPYLRGRP